MNHVRNILDPISPQTVFPLIADIGEGLYRNGYLGLYRRIGNTLLIALDAWGVWYASWGATLHGDDLYCHQDFCQSLRLRSGEPLRLRSGEPC